MSTAEPSPGDRNAWIAYVAPMATFLILTSLESAIWYPIAYILKTAIVTGVLIACRKTIRDLRPTPGPVGWALSVAIGLLVTLAWVGLDGWYPAIPGVGARSSFNPDELAPPVRIMFLVARIYGLVLLVPLFEELFWRSFAIRYAIDADFTRVPIGRVTPLAAGITAGLFALAHPAEWLPALLTGLAWAWLLARTKSITACVASHAVANLALGVYILTTHQWKYW